jgi:hypothetical protein
MRKKTKTLFTITIVNVAVVLLNVGLVIVPKRRETGF